MKVELLQAKKNIKLSPVGDMQYVLISNEETAVEIALDKKGVSVELLVFFAVRNKDKVKLTTKTMHKVPHTSCMVNIKGVLFDSAMADYVGKIIIEKNAQQTVSFLEDNVLSVGNKTKNRSQPILEIEADDVKASHGATTGRVDEDQVYYLMSRGMSRKEAEKAVIEGFFEAGLSLIKDVEVRGKVKKGLNV